MKNKTKSKVFLVLMAVILLLQSVSSSDVLTAHANNDDMVVTPGPADPDPKPSIPAPTIQIKRKAFNNNDGDGIIMNDEPVVPNSWDSAKAQAAYPGIIAPNHTGWSTTGSVRECKITSRTAIGYDGNPVTPDVSYPNRSDKVWWWKDNWRDITYKGGESNRYGAFHYNTFNQFDEGSLETYRGQLDSKYSHLLNKEYNGVLLKSWEGVRGKLAGVGYWLKGERTNNADSMVSCGEIGDGGLQYLWSYHDNEIIMEGSIQANLPDPSDTYPAPNRTKGDVSGTAYWELVRHNENARSGVDAFVDLKVAGEHYATRNVQQTATLGNQSNTVGRDTPIKLRIDDGMTVKNKSLAYGFEYEYTNFYRDIYECTDRENGYCYDWKFVERVPDWDKAETFTFQDSVKVDHRMEEVISEDKIEDVLNSFLMGRKVVIKSSTQKNNTPYYENFSKNAKNDRKSMTELMTQTSLPITPGELDYKVAFPSGAHGGNNVLRKEKTYGYYFPADVDDSLKERYKNTTEYRDYEYAFPLQQSTQTGPNSNQVWDYDTDLFFMSYALGYISGYPYADMVKQKMMHGRNLPSYNQLMKDGSEKLEREFIEDWDYGFFDHVLYTDDPSEFWKIQRHQLPIQGDSILHPNELYKNHLVLKNMGLNDLTFRFNQSFSFKHYMFGHGADEAFIIEQVESRPTKMHEYDPAVVHTITITNDQIKQLAAQQVTRPKGRIHGFRRIDRDIIEKTEAIVGEVPVGD